MLFRLLIFDFDGTIANTSPLIFASFNAVAQKYLGKTFSPQEIIALYGPTEDEIIAQLVKPEQRDHALAEFYSVYGNNPQMVEPFDGIAQLFSQAQQQGIILGIFTGKCRRTCLINLNQLGYAPYFSYVITGDDIIHRKPHPEGINKILTVTGSNPDETIYIGDSVADMKAGRAAGVKTGAAFWDPLADKRILDLNPDYIFNTISDLRKLLLI
ncbi:MAG: HAD family hydrolase [bacterium]|nr:HAD family hydrolase [bacterium]